MGFLINPYSFAAKLPITLDTTDGSTGSNSASITIATNANRILVVHLGYGRSSGYSVTSVKIGATNFTNLATVNSTTAFYEYTDVWFLINPPTGVQTVDVVYAVAPTYKAMKLISLYNVDQSVGISSITKVSFGGIESNPFTLTITPTTVGSWIMAFMLSQNNNSAPTQTALYTGYSNGDAALSGEYNPTPTISSSNNLSWTVSPTTLRLSGIAFEILRA